VTKAQAIYERDAKRRLWVARVYGTGNIVTGRTVGEARRRLLRATGYCANDVEDDVILPNVVKRRLNVLEAARGRGSGVLPVPDSFMRTAKKAVAQAFKAMGLGLREAASLAGVSKTTMWRWTNEVERRHEK